MAGAGQDYTKLLWLARSIDAIGLQHLAPELTACLNVKYVTVTCGGCLLLHGTKYLVARC